MRAAVVIAVLILLAAPLALGVPPAPERERLPRIGKESPATTGLAGVATPEDNPYLRLAPPRPIPARFDGPPAAVDALESRRAEPRALASADFDEDGVPDLVCGFADGEQGIVTIHRGNVDAIHPNAPEARERRRLGTHVDAPFWPDAKAFVVPEPVDFIGAGDFDADGHCDVVTARREGDPLWLHRGDGSSVLAEPEGFPLPGTLTALRAGEVNRRNRLTDLVVAVVSDPGGESAGL